VDWKNFPREEVDCILCRSDDAVLLSTIRSWPVVRCRNCGLVYLRERPAEDALTEMYAKSYYDDGDVGYSGYEELFLKYKTTFMRIFQRRHRDLLKHSAGLNLLEVGCAHGFLLDYLSKKDWKVTGVEVSPLSSAYARDTLNLNVHTGTVKSADFPENSFDVVLLLDVLEHLHRPFDTLHEISRILSPGGTLVVQCPWELYHWEEIFEALLQGMKAGTIEPDAVPAHLYFFQPKTLESVLKKGGFRITARQSGNYGAIRNLESPPAIKGNFIEKAFRFLYFRCGTRHLLYKLAKFTGQGNGIIRYSTPKGKQ